MPTNLQSRIVVHEESIDTTGFVDHAALARAQMDRPDQLTPVITMLFGSWKASVDRFPLLYMTEGQRGKSTRSIPLNNLQYEYPVIGKRKTTEKIVSSPYSTSDTPGIGNTDFFAVFPTAWFTYQQTIENRHYDVKARVMSRPVRQGNHWRYTLRLFNPDPTSYADPRALQAGQKWGELGGATVSPALSVGNYGKVQNPGKRKNQISVLRQSYKLAGNISSKVVEFRLFDENGNPSSLYIDWYEFQQMLRWRESKEQHLWLSEYSRDAFGRNPLVDPDTGQIIPTGAGLKQQIPNSHSYTKLTEKLFRSIVGDVFRGTPDTNMMDVILYCGEGFAEEFDEAMKDSHIFRLIAEGFGATDKFVRSAGGNLQLGGYFRSYKHQDQHIITLKQLPFLNEGGYADASPRHPVTGRPLSSYEAYFVDQSVYDGEPNIRMVHEEGRMEIRGLEQGMALVKGSNFGDYKGNKKYLNLSTEQDATAIHFMGTCGVQMLRDTHSFKLLPNINALL